MANIARFRGTVQTAEICCKHEWPCDVQYAWKHGCTDEWLEKSILTSASVTPWVLRLFFILTDAQPDFLNLSLFLFSPPENKAVSCFSCTGQPHQLNLHMGNTDEEEGRDNGKVTSSKTLSGLPHSDHHV